MKNILDNKDAKVLRDKVIERVRIENDQVIMEFQDGSKFILSLDSYTNVLKKEHWDNN